MELKLSIMTTFVLIILLATPLFSRGKELYATKSSDVYDIDYRGAETHTYLPPERFGRWPHKNGKNLDEDRRYSSIQASESRVMQGNINQQRHGK
ncbi:hypothetical protein AKJ16_DCAP09498 [Drosera capensis]